MANSLPLYLGGVSRGNRCGDDVTVLGEAMMRGGNNPCTGLSYVMFYPTHKETGTRIEFSLFMLGEMTRPIDGTI